MNRAIRFVLCVIVGSAILLSLRGGTTPGIAAPQKPAVAQALGPPSNTGGSSFTPFVHSYFYPSFDFYGGFSSPFLFLPSLPPPYPYMPNYWWVSPYPVADPRQAGYNPSGGYPWESVTTLLLVTFPAKSRITLDGIFVGNSDSLGPIQLPIGQHILRVEAAGYEPSETVLKIDQPVLQQLEVRLNSARPGAKPGPRR